MKTRCGCGCCCPRGLVATSPTLLGSQALAWRRCARPRPCGERPLDKACEAILLDHTSPSSAHRGIVSPGDDRAGLRFSIFTTAPTAPRPPSLVLRMPAPSRRPWHMVSGLLIEAMHAHEFVLRTQPPQARRKSDSRSMISSLGWWRTDASSDESDPGRSDDRPNRRVRTDPGREVAGSPP
jgi:hypothetical protein